MSSELSSLASEGSRSIANARSTLNRLGLKFRLYSCEVLFNRGLASIYMASLAHSLELSKHAHRSRM